MRDGTAAPSDWIAPPLAWAEGPVEAETEAPELSLGVGVEELEGLAPGAAAAGPVENSLTRTCDPNQPEKRAAWLVVTGRALACPACQTNRSGPVLLSVGAAEKATHVPSGENSGSRPTTLNPFKIAVGTLTAGAGEGATVGLAVALSDALGDTATDALAEAPDELLGVEPPADVGVAEGLELAVKVAVIVGVGCATSVVVEVGRGVI